MSLFSCFYKKQQYRQYKQQCWLSNTRMPWHKLTFTLIYVSSIITEQISPLWGFLGRKDISFLFPKSPWQPDISFLCRRKRTDTLTRHIMFRLAGFLRRIRQLNKVIKYRLTVLAFFVFCQFRHRELLAQRATLTWSKEYEDISMVNTQQAECN